MCNETEIEFIIPSARVITERDPLKRIELCGRVCYKSEDKITDTSSRAFVEKIVKRGHTSVLEHARVKVPKVLLDDIECNRFGKEAKSIYGLYYRLEEELYHYNINARDFIAIGGTLDELATLENADGYITVKFFCDRGISHELVRHRQMSFSQESTRYVNYNGKPMQFVLPLPFMWSPGKYMAKHNDSDDWMKFKTFHDLCVASSVAYKRMIDEGCTPQEARLVLPNAVKTELIMTGTAKQWRDVYKLRSESGAHPQVKLLMEILKGNKDFMDVAFPEPFDWSDYGITK